MRRRALVAAVLAIMLATWTVSPAAFADGDPGSDVLVYQDLFAGSDTGLSVSQQVQLGTLLKSASRADVPIRVAIISSQDDLGSVTALWRQPRAYARFLGIELSLAYKQRLLVVMPNGAGVQLARSHPRRGLPDAGRCGGPVGGRRPVCHDGHGGARVGRRGRRHARGCRHGTGDGRRASGDGQRQGAGPLRER